MVLFNPEMGLLKPGMDPSVPSIVPTGLELTLSSLARALYDVQKFLLYLLFFTFDNSGPFEKIVGQVLLVFDLGRGYLGRGPLGAGLRPPPPQRKSCDRLYRMWGV